MLDYICFLYRLESSFRSFSRPVLHAASRVVQEMGKSRAAAFALGIQDIDEGAHLNDSVEYIDEDINPLAEGNLSYCASVLPLHLFIQLYRTLLFYDSVNRFIFCDLV